MKQINNLHLIETDLSTNLILDKGKLEYIPTAQKAKTINSSCNGYFLYITDDSDIYANDYVVYGDRVLQTHILKECGIVREGLWVIRDNRYLKISKYNKKVIATNDPNLINSENKRYPTIPLHFVESYIVAYNTNKKVNECEIEYKECEIPFHDDFGSDDTIYLSSYTDRQLVVDKYNLVNCNLFERLYTREEIFNLFVQLEKERSRYYPEDANDIVKLDDFLKHNL